MIFLLTIDGISFGHYAFNIITNHQYITPSRCPGFSDLLSVHLSNLILLYKLAALSSFISLPWSYVMMFLWYVCLDERCLHSSRCSIL